MDLAKLDTPALVKLLEHPNSWMRRKARRVLSEQTKISEDTLKSLTEAAYAKGNIEAFWTL